jgi:hypothetical protein
LVVAGATRKTERQKDEGPFSGSGSPHLSGRQHRPRVGAVPALIIGEGGRRAQLVPAVVEVEEVVEEVVRAMARKAALKKIHIRLALPVVARSQIVARKRRVLSQLQQLDRTLFGKPHASPHRYCIGHGTSPSSLLNESPLSLDELLELQQIFYQISMAPRRLPL